MMYVQEGRTIIKAIHLVKEFFREVIEFFGVVLLLSIPAVSWAICSMKHL
jgi:hypothetical protein